MNYKITALPEKVVVNQNLLPEIAGLFCCLLNDEKAVFDYTAYFEENNIEPIDVKVFMQYNKRYIEELAKSSNIKTSQLFYQNKDGHILVDYMLVFLFLAFANPDLLRYFNSLLGYVMTEGVAYSNGFIYSQAMNRLPTEILQDIIDQRNGTGE